MALREGGIEDRASERVASCQPSITYYDLLFTGQVASLPYKFILRDVRCKEATLKRMSTNLLYPIYLHSLADQLVIVVGGGRVGERKIAGLLTVGAQVRLISPATTPKIETLAASGAIEWLARPYQSGDLLGAYLAFAATDQRSVNIQVGQDARALGVFCNVADAPDEGDFHLPALHRQDDLTIAVGTGGSSPTRAKKVRDWIIAALSERLGD